MRDAIDPEENQYYQAIIWLAPERPKYFDRAAHALSWTGVRWIYADLDSLPSIPECSTALVALHYFDDSDLARVPDVLNSLESRGTMIGAVIAWGPHAAWSLHRQWREQVHDVIKSRGESPAMPLIVAVDVSHEAYAVLKLLNQLTYSAMLVCVDWFDLRLAAAEWEQPCRYRSGSGESLEDAIASLTSHADNSPTITLAVLFDQEFSLDNFSKLSDAIEEFGADSKPLLITSLAPDDDVSSAIDAGWFESLPEPISPPRYATQAAAKSYSEPVVGIYWNVLGEVVMDVVPLSQAAIRDGMVMHGNHEAFWTDFTPRTSTEEILKDCGFDVFPRWQVVYCISDSQFYTHMSEPIIEDQ